jgi:hypothetical protein
LLALINNFQVTIFEKTENQFTLKISDPEAEDLLRHSIYSDYLKRSIDTEGTKLEHVPVGPDFSATCSVDDKKELRITIDVKSSGTQSSIHKADLVLRYKADYADRSGTCWLQVPKQSKLLDILPTSELDEINRALATAQLSFEIGITGAGANDISYFANASAYLELVDIVLKSKSTTYKHVVDILNDKSDDLAKTATDIMADAPNDAVKLYVAPPRNLNTKTKTSDNAAQRLRSVADYLADVVVLNARNKN